MHLKLKHAVLAFAAAGILTAAKATPLVANTPTANVDIVASYFGGTLLDSAITNISNLSYTGIARAAVYDTGTGLDFYYQFSNDPSSPHGVARFSFSDFSALNGDPIDIYQTASAFGIFVDGTEISEYADRTDFGVLGVSFIPDESSKVEPGTTSYIQIIRTSARDYMPGYFGLLNGFGDTAVGFAPTVLQVSEPGSYSLLMGALGLLGAMGRRRRHSA